MDGARDRPATADQRRGRDKAFPRLLGGQLCLDFANTIDTPRAEPQDFLTDYAALVRWGHHRSLLDNTAVERLLADGAAHPEEAAATFACAIALRGAVQRSFAAIAIASAPPPDDLALVHDCYVAGLSRARLVARNGQFAWESAGDAAASRLIWPIVQSAVELLTSGDLARVKQCSCGWLFHDVSKNGSRRWCSMEGCGAHAKMRRYNARRRLARGERER